MGSYVFFLSYARDDDGPELERFVADLEEALRGRLGLAKEDRVVFRDEHGIPFGSPQWFGPVEAALAEAQAFVALFTPRYFQRPLCGQEWAAFRRRLQGFAETSGGSLPGLIFPVLWIPVGERQRAALPQHVRDVQYTHGQFGDLYSREGLLYLLQTEKKVEYRELLTRLSQAMLRAIEEAPMAPTVPAPRLADFLNAFADVEVVEAPAPTAPERPAAWGRDRRLDEEMARELEGGLFFGEVREVVRLRESPVELETVIHFQEPSRGHLRVTVLQGGFRESFPVGVGDGPVSREAIYRFLEEVVAPYRYANPQAGALWIYRGAVSPAELIREAEERRLRLVRMVDYQRGLIDFAPYLARQAEDLAREEAYPPALYVEQRMLSELGREAREKADALAEVRSWLGDERGHFVLVLGEFGTGKTFLLYQLARQLAGEPEAPVPILLQMRALEKGKGLDELLVQHFAKKGMTDFSARKFRYLLEQGLVVLLFDGFDELELRVTYARAAEHFETLLQAAGGRGKVVVTSRRQHFLTDQQARTALLQKVETLGGRRIATLLPFSRDQIRAFLRNRFGPTEAETRLELLERVRDLMGLSANPRLLSFISELSQEELTRAAARTGEVTAASLYELLVKKWLLGEQERVDLPGAPLGLSMDARWAAITALALRLWEKTDRFVDLNDLNDEAARVVKGLDQKHFGPEGAAFQIGSGTLLVRDEEGRFSFLHQSILEWLVAREAAREIAAGKESQALARREISLLMAEFFCDLATKEKAAAWARAARRGGAGEVAQRNALQILSWLGEASGKGLILVGKDLRGQDFTGRNLDGADLSGADLSGVSLRGASLLGARIRKAKLVGADLSEATLRGADLSAADLTSARLLGADLRRTSLEGARLRRAKLLGALRDGGGWSASDLFGATPVELESLVTLSGWPPNWVTTVAFSPDGELMASGSADGSVCFWEVSTGREIRQLRGEGGSIGSVMWSPGGGKLASSSADGVLRLWEISTGREIRKLRGEEGSVWSVVWSPEGGELASGSADGIVRLWEASTGREIRQLRGEGGSIRSVAWSPGGGELASGSDDGVVRLWEVLTGREIRQLRGEGEHVLSVAWSPGGGELASSSADGIVRLWEVSTGREIRQLRGEGGSVRSVAWSPEGGELASGSDDGTVRLWEVSTGREIHQLRGAGRLVRSVVWSPGGGELASGSDDGTVRLWEVSTGREIRKLRGDGRIMRSVAWSPGGGELASGSTDGTVRFWEVSTGREIRKLPRKIGVVLSVVWSPGGREVASISDDGTIRLLEFSTGRVIRQLRGDRGSVKNMVWSPGGGELASGSDDGTVRLWEVTSGREIRQLRGTGGSVRGVAWSPGGEELASVSADGVVRLWEVSTGREIRQLRGEGGSVWSVVWSPGGGELASVSDDGTIRLWEVSSGREIRQLRGEGRRVLSVVWSPGGGELASGSSDGTVLFWEVSSGREIRHLSGEGGIVLSVAWSPGGGELATVSFDGKIRIWDVATGRCLVILVPLPEGWAAYTPDGRYKVGGIPAGGFWHAINLCRFEVGELDDWVPGLRLADDASFFDLPPWTPTLKRPER